MRLYSRAATVARLHASVICLFLTHALAATDFCFTRQACGEANISSRGCEERGCCWDDAADASGPRCFYRGSNVETCATLKQRAACGGVAEGTDMVEQATNSEGYGYIPDDNVPPKPVVQEDHGEITVEVRHTEGYGQHPDEETAESLEETFAEASVAEGVGENADLVEQVIYAEEETEEIVEEAFAEAPGADDVQEPSEITTEEVDKEAYGYSSEGNPKQLTSEAGAEGIGHHEEVTMEVVQTEGVGEHPEDAVSESDGSDAPSEDRKPETVILQSAKQPQSEKSESESDAEMSLETIEIEDLEEPWMDISLAYASVGAPESMMELEDMPLLSHASEFHLTYATKSETHMPIQRKEKAAVFKSKLETICQESIESKIEKIGWLVLLKDDEPIELFTFKKESGDDSDNRPSAAGSASLLKSPRTQFAKKPIEVVPTSSTTDYPLDSFKSTNELIKTDSKQSWPSSHGSDRVPQANTAGSTEEIEGVMDNTVKHRITEVVPERTMPDPICSLSKHIPCGNGKVTKKECKDQGCCWVPLSRHLIQTGCYLPQPEVEAITFDLEQVSI